MMRWALSLARLACTSQWSICNNLIRKIASFSLQAHCLTSTFWWIWLKSCIEIWFLSINISIRKGLNRKKLSLLSMIKVKKTDDYLITFWGWCFWYLKNQIKKKIIIIFTRSDIYGTMYSRKSHSANFEF